MNVLWFLLSLALAGRPAPCATVEQVQAAVNEAVSDYLSSPAPVDAAWPWPGSVEPVYPVDARPCGVVPIVIIEP